MFFNARMKPGRGEIPALLNGEWDHQVVWGGGAVCHYKKIINQIGAVNLSTRGLIMQDYNMYIFTQLSFEMLYLMRPLEMLAPQSPPSPFSKVKIMVLSMEI